jgi:arylsulfatase A-like enzyme
MLDEALPHLPTLGNLQQSGATFSQFVVTTPLCSPSRATLLRGQYAHNHGVLQNRGNKEIEGGFPSFYQKEREESTVATWLQAAGYRTAMLGKYLNDFPLGASPAYVPPGWDEWIANSNDARGAFYFDYTFNENGTLRYYGSAAEDYSTDVLAAKSANFVRQSAARGQPFFLYVAPYAPHDPAVPAPRHVEAFGDSVFPVPPSFGEDDVSDKPTWVKALEPLAMGAEEDVDARWRVRLRTLLAVDDLLRTIGEAIATSGLSNQTYVMVVSDNGFHFGEHRINYGKVSPYEESIRVPFLVQGPGIAPGITIDRLVANIDLAPTIADLASVNTPPFVDGRSFAPLLTHEPTLWRSVVLVEQFEDVAERLRREGTTRRQPSRGQVNATLQREPDTTPEAKRPERGRPQRQTEFAIATQAPVPSYRGLRADEFLFVRYDSGEVELYDLEMDPYQMDNLAPGLDQAMLTMLLQRLAGMEACAGPVCRALENAPVQLDGTASGLGGSRPET